MEHIEDQASKLIKILTTSGPTFIQKANTPTYSKPGPNKWPKCGHPRDPRNTIEAPGRGRNGSGRVEEKCKKCYKTQKRKRNAIKGVRYLEMAIAKRDGAGWAEIAAEFGYPNAIAAKEAFARLGEEEGHVVSSTIQEIREEMDQRLEFIYSNLVPAIAAADRGTPRAAEVAIKTLERRARLHGVDAVEENSINRGPVQQQAVVINITAHPGDEQAQSLLIEGRSSEVDGGERAGQILSPPNQSLPEHKEDNFFGRWDRFRQNMVRSVLDSRET